MPKKKAEVLAPARFYCNLGGFDHNVAVFAFALRL
jgi:hypothetical protein